ncbi:hypothetical protein NPIL_307861 [Nephila pilipes]|uniref:Uncharacterized protein n=1 Tax=Nephila pilipes TaxID=299642 RepID=A0A8X6QJH6_NEPPI|nr:hypothetical protein NPIL_307861 [Nephila pilipes]
MDAQNNWSDRTEFAMEQNELNTTENIDQGAAITASPASRVFDEDFFVQNYSTTRRAIQGRNAYAAWARKLGLTKKDDPEFLRIHDELRRAGENLNKVLANLGDIPLFKLPASEKELDAMTQKPLKTASTQVNVIQPIAVVPLSQDRSDSASQGKKSNKRTRDSEGFISPPKHLTRKAPKANPNVDKIDDAPTPDPDVDVNILDPVANTPQIGVDAHDILLTPKNPRKREQKRTKQTRERTTPATPSSQSESSHPHLPAPTSPGIGR